MDINSLKHPIHSGPFVSKFGSYKKYRQYCLDEGLAKITKNGVFLFIGQSHSYKKQQGRNEPCNCGSGKKFKKCCWK
jgi:uncharacterized protein YchJ|tara:strand:+ start:548 stop:778 length:231 start_codon:yes stop_codon:yes gene_type:complete